MENLNFTKKFDEILEMVRRGNAKGYEILRLYEDLNDLEKQGFLFSCISVSIEYFKLIKQEIKK